MKVKQIVITTRSANGNELFILKQIKLSFIAAKTTGVHGTSSTIYLECLCNVSVERKVHTRFCFQEFLEH